MTTKSYVSRHIYKTERGNYVDDRTGHRVTRRRGVSTEKAVERSRARFRDDSGKFETREFGVNYDASSVSDHRHGTDYSDPETGPQDYISIAYNPNINPNLSESAARKLLDMKDPSKRHYNVAVREPRSGEEEFDESG